MGCCCRWLFIFVVGGILGGGVMWYCDIVVVVVGEWLGVVEQWLLFATLLSVMWPTFCC